MQKVVKAEEVRPDVPIKDVLEETGTRPMSKLSKQFDIENVAVVKGVLRKFNDELFPELPIRKGEGFLNKLFGRDKITDELFLFVDRSGKNTSQELLRLPGHGRNFSFNVKFSDAEGNVYSYIDIKGGGLSGKGSRKEAETVRTEIVEQAKWRKVSVRGMGDWEEATKDWETSEFFRKKGVKVAPPIAIVEIEEFILADGTKVSVKDAMKRMLPRNLEYHGETYKNRPVLYLRAFTEVMRLSDATKDDFEKFAKEHGKSLDEYLNWLGGKMADNLIKIHKSGIAHKNLIAHNWTIDGHVVDFDTVEKADSEKILDDASFTVAAMHSMCVVKGSLSEDDSTRLLAAFLRKYLVSPCINKDEIIVLYGIYDTSLKTNENDSIKSLYKRVMQEIAELYKKRFGEDIDYSKYVGDEPVIIDKKH